MKKLLIVANWKMNMLLDESISYVKKLNKLIKGIKNREVVICSPFTLLYPLKNALENTNIKLGAQDAFYADSGAFTGEISPLMLKGIGCEYVIIGHSERRQYFNETNETVNKKLKAVLDNNLKPIMCIGEKHSERQADSTFDVIEDQLLVGLRDIPKEKLKNLIIAYEPVWAIGTGINAVPSQAEEVHSFIRKVLEENYGVNIKILYGGSVTQENSKDLLNEKDVDGLLVGGASLDVEKFAKIIACGF